MHIKNLFPAPLPPLMPHQSIVVPVVAFDWPEQEGVWSYLPLFLQMLRDGSTRSGAEAGDRFDKLLRVSERASKTALRFFGVRVPWAFSVSHLRFCFFRVLSPSVRFLFGFWIIF